MKCCLVVLAYAPQMYPMMPQQAPYQPQLPIVPQQPFFQQDIPGSFGGFPMHSGIDQSFNFFRKKKKI